MAFFGRAQFLRLGKGNGQSLEQCLALGVVVDGSGERGEGIEVGDFGFDGRAVSRRMSGSTWFVFHPFLGSFIECFVVLVQFFFQAIRWLLLA